MKPAVWLFVVLAACGGARDPRGVSTASRLVTSGDGYTFRRVTSMDTEASIARAFGKASVVEVISVIARKGAEPVGPVDVIVLNEPVTSREWVDRFHPRLHHDDISESVGADAVLFTGSAIGAVMVCRSEPSHVLIRGSATRRAPLVAVMKELASRCD